MLSCFVISKLWLLPVACQTPILSVVVLTLVGIELGFSVFAGIIINIAIFVIYFSLGKKMEQLRYGETPELFLPVIQNASSVNSYPLNV